MNTDQVDINLSSGEEKRVLDEVLNKSFHIPYNFNYNDVFIQMTKEQVNVLNYLTEQRTAVISGIAGTGKTMIAVEKANRHAQNNEKVLFLCYNAKLKEYLVKNNKSENITYNTIDGFACSECGLREANYVSLKNHLENIYFEETPFVYDHIIIDEGQDFGKYDIEKNGILQLLKEIITKKETGSFYLFYDKFQFVQGSKFPQFINDADCKLTLYKNCRNTINIAQTSLSLHKAKSSLFEGAIQGENTYLYNCEDENKLLLTINNIIDKHLSKGVNDIVIITTSSEHNSMFFNYTKNNEYVYRSKTFTFTTSRKFKGLEAEAVILIDVDASVLTNDINYLDKDSKTFVNNKNIFYVGASRAKLYLDIITLLNSDEFSKVLKVMTGETTEKSVRAKLAAELMCEMKNF